MLAYLSSTISLGTLSSLCLVWNSWPSTVSVHCLPALEQPSCPSREPQVDCVLSFKSHPPQFWTHYPFSSPLTTTSGNWVPALPLFGLGPFLILSHKITEVRTDPGISEFSLWKCHQWISWQLSHFRWSQSCTGNWKCAGQTLCQWSYVPIS